MALPPITIQTGLGVIRISLADDRARLSATNFRRYVAAHDYDGGSFHRVVRSDRPGGNPTPIDVVQAQVADSEGPARFPPIPMESTAKTGLGHVRGAVSMARDGPDTATSSFFIVMRDSLELDFAGKRNPDGQGFAVFGQVVAGWEVLEAIYRRAAGGDLLTDPVSILRVRADLP